MEKMVNLEDLEESQNPSSDEVVPSTEETNISSTEQENLIQKLYKDIKLKDEDNCRLKIDLKMLRKLLFEMEINFVPDTFDSNLDTIFILLKKNQEEQDESESPYGFYALRIQRKNELDSLQKLKARYPKCEVFYRSKDPNAVNFFNCLKELKVIETKGNHLKSTLPDEELFVQIKKLHENKLNEFIDCKLHLKIENECFIDLTGNACNKK